MKISHLFITALAITSLYSCNNSQKQADTPPASEQKVVTAPAPAETVVVVKEQPKKEDGTTIKVGPDGVSVKTNKTNVNLANDSAAIEIRTK